MGECRHDNHHRHTLLDRQGAYWCDVHRGYWVLFRTREAGVVSDLKRLECDGPIPSGGETYSPVLSTQANSCTERAGDPKGGEMRITSRTQDPEHGGPLKQVADTLTDTLTETIEAIDAYGDRPFWRGRLHLLAAIVAVPAGLALVLAAQGAAARLQPGSARRAS
ncbi:MAG: hypothetical protein M5U19_17310 [Microthrixaceae bacterium]|nr:hypothetical protein [Microthrixaceae bacterium]